MKSALGAALVPAAGSVAVVVTGKAVSMPGFAERNTIFVSARTFPPALGARLVSLAPNK